MFIRAKETKNRVTGTTYVKHQLVRSVRYGDKVRQEIVMELVNGHAIMHRCGQIIARWRTPKLHAHLGPGSRWTTRTSLRRNSESIGCANGDSRMHQSTHHVEQCTTA